MRHRLIMPSISCALIVSLIAVSVLVPVVSAQIPEVAVSDVYWGSGSTKLEPEPGDVNVPLTVVIRNVGQQSFLSLTATLFLDKLPFTNAIGELKAVAGYGSTLAIGETASLEFTVNIASDAQLLSYNVPLTLNIRTLQYSNGIDISRNLPVELKGKVSLNLEASPNTVNPGTSTLSLAVENTGTATASEVEAAVTVPSPLVRLGGDNILSFQSVAPNARVSSSIILFAPISAIGSGVKISVSLSYDDAYGNTREVEKAIGIFVSNQTVAASKVSFIRATWGDAVVDAGVSPGERSAPLFVTIQNLGSNTLSGLEASLFLSPPFSDAVLGGNVTSTVAPDVNPGQTAALRFSLNIASDAPVGTHMLRMTLNYLIRNDLSTPVDYIRAPPAEFEIPVAVGGKTKLLVSVSRSEMDQGTVESYPISVKNSGVSDIRDLELRLTLLQAASSTSALGATQTSTKLTLLGGDNFWHFDVLRGGGTVTVAPSVAASEDSAGNYQLTLTLTYVDPLGKTKTETRTLGLSVKPRVPSSVVGLTIRELSSEIIRQGDVFNIGGQVQNLGESTAQAVSVRIITPQSFASISPTTINIGDLKPGESGDARFTVMVAPSASVGVIHPLQFTITYSDYKGDRQSSTVSVGVPVHGIIELTTYEFSMSPSLVMTGEDFEVSFTLVNKGTVPALFTNVSLTSGGPFLTLPESSDYVGQVDPDAPVPISLATRVDPSAEEGTHPLRVQIAYKDEFHTVRTEFIELQVNVVPWSPPQASQSSSLSQPFEGFTLWLSQVLIVWLVVPVAVVAVSVAALLFRRSRKPR